MIFLLSVWLSTLVCSAAYNVLVTGVGGFVGFHTSLKLKSMGHNVVGIDNMNLYYTPALKRARVQLLSESNIPFHVIDVCDGLAVTRLIEDNKINRIIHLAAQAGVRYSIKFPFEYTHNNVDCFVTLLEVLKGRNIPLVYASSSSVYGRNTKIPFSEQDEVNNPASLYASTKRSNELLARTYLNLYNQSSIGLRFFTVYGPWGRPDMAYFSFVSGTYLYTAQF